MHGDFNSELGKVICADKSIFLSKKCYVSRLVLENDKIDYRVRSKGLTKESIDETCINYNVNMM